MRELLTVNPVTQQDHAFAISVAESTGYSFYDSLIVASALSAECTILFTEDLQSGQIIAGRLTIRNPFKA
jgi:predicted nucleic acid-binding protein